MVTAEDKKDEDAAAITARDLYRQARDHAAAQEDHDVQDGLNRLTAWMRSAPADAPEHADTGQYWIARAGSPSKDARELGGRRGQRMSLQQDIGRVPVDLVEYGKSVDRPRGRISLGAIKLRRWQAHWLGLVPVDLASVPADLVDRAAYLARINYEFDLDPDAPPLAWAEVGFEFPDDVVVHDAVPLRVVSQADAATYTLTEGLNFARRDGGGEEAWPAGAPAASIALPPLVPRIDSFGLGTSLIKWRHSGEVPAGTHVGWVVLLAPQDWDEVPVVATGNYRVETDPALGLRPAGQRDAFTVRLPAAPAEAPTRLALPAPEAPGGRTRVFVSYAHESAEHTAAVTEFCAFLSSKGLDVRFDRQWADQRRDWSLWINTEIRRANYVIAIASPAYRAAGDGTLAADERLGVLFEYERLADLLHRSRGEWTRKILPVVLPGRSPEEIPLSFLPSTADHYTVSSFSDQGAAALLRVLLQPEPDPGQVVV